jgi:hypothetical protein
MNCIYRLTKRTFVWYPKGNPGLKNHYRYGCVVIKYNIVTLVSLGEVTVSSRKEKRCDPGEFKVLRERSEKDYLLPCEVA